MSDETIASKLPTEPGVWLAKRYDEWSTVRVISVRGVLHGLYAGQPFPIADFTVDEWGPLLESLLAERTPRPVPEGEVCPAGYFTTAGDMGTVNVHADICASHMSTESACNEARDHRDRIGRDCFPDLAARIEALEAENSRLRAEVTEVEERVNADWQEESQRQIAARNMALADREKARDDRRTALRERDDARAERDRLVGRIDALDVAARALPLGKAWRGGGLHDASMYNAAKAAIRYMRGERGDFDYIVPPAPTPGTSGPQDPTDG